MNRFLTAIATVAMVLAPATASAATPSPSPSLDTVLAKPPSPDFVQLTSGSLHGEFTAHDWAANANGVSATETEATLNTYGFVDGYGLEWTSTSQRRALVEVVMAFTGGQGAQKTLTALERADKSDAHYVHANTLADISPSYGVHVFDASKGVYEDGFGFAKGNDVFVIYVASTKDDNLDMATSQAKTQHDGAPDSTIPSAQWPENAQSSSSSAAFGAGSVFGLLIVLVLVLGVIGVVVGLVLRARRRPVAVAAGYAAVAPSGVQMSPDGSYWYDGQSWRDAATEVPPGAQRSSDGTLWWDGRTWRPVPQSGPPPQAPQAPPAQWPS